ncbi:MAG: transcription factor TFIIIB subunit brf1 [Alyxoria varia]|nr:MAG: transcription factor TFIIIB subunit brf1 [Alyxoria varia]
MSEPGDVVETTERPSPTPSQRSKRMYSIKDHPHGRHRPTPPQRQPKKKLICSLCKNQKPEKDDQGNTVCGICGNTIDDTHIVADVEFGETAGGAAVPQGGQVGADQRNARTMGAGAGEARESREITMLYGRSEIRRQGSALHIAESVQDNAFEIYKMALNLNFIQGRRIAHCAAVCLYISCRRIPGQTTLLIDFSEALKVNVYKLGECYKDLKKEAFLDRYEAAGMNPLINMEDVLLRYARKLEFGDDLHKVADDASKLMKRLQRDWLTDGRIPSGLIGACIIMAARMNNYRRSTREVVYTVKVSDPTIMKRLEEFKDTESSGLTVQQFRENALRLRKQMDPPAFQRAEAERKRKRQEEEGEEEAGGQNAEGTEDNPQVVEDGTSQPSTGDQHQPSAVSTVPQSRHDKDGFLIPPLPSGKKTKNAALQTSTPDTSQTSNQSSQGSANTATQPEDQPHQLETPETSQSTSQSSHSQSSGTPPEGDQQPPRKKRRGRPRKGEEHLTAKAQKVKRPRGRPPKNPRPREIMPHELITEDEELELQHEIESVMVDPDFIKKMDDEILSKHVANAKKIAEEQRAMAREKHRKLREHMGVTTENIEDSGNSLEEEIDDEADLAEEDDTTAGAVNTLRSHEQPSTSALLFSLGKRKRTLDDDPPAGEDADNEENETGEREEDENFPFPDEADAAGKEDTEAPAEPEPDPRLWELDDDPEVQRAVLSDAQRRVKESIWVTHNEEWLREKQVRDLRKTMDEENPPPKKNRSGKRSRIGDGSVLQGGPPVKNAADATWRMLEKRAGSTKAISQFVNREIIERVYGAWDTSSENGNSRSSEAASGAHESSPIAVSSGGSDESGSRSATPAARAGAMKTKTTKTTKTGTKLAGSKRARGDEDEEEPESSLGRDSGSKRRKSDDAASRQSEARMSETPSDGSTRNKSLELAKEYVRRQEELDAAERAQSSQASDNGDEEEVGSGGEQDDVESGEEQEESEEEEEDSSEEEEDSEEEQQPSKAKYPRFNTAGELLDSDEESDSD